MKTDRGERQEMLAGRHATIWPGMGISSAGDGFSGTDLRRAGRRGFRCIFCPESLRWGQRTYCYKQLAAEATTTSVPSIKSQCGDRFRCMYSSMVVNGHWGNDLLFRIICISIEQSVGCRPTYEGEFRMNW